MFRFADPYWLSAFAMVPVVVLVRRRRRSWPTLRISSISCLDTVPQSLALRLRRLVPALKLGAFVLMVLSMARPQWGSQEVMVLTEGINIVLAVDISESMSALDFKRGANVVNRLDAVKGVIEDFVKRREGDRIGLVVFGSAAYTQLPLTRDYDSIVSILDHVKIGAAGSSTAIGDAIGISVKRLQDVKSRSNVIILLTDGQSNTGELSPMTAAEMAGELGVRIYTIGVGTRGRVPIPVDDPIYGRRIIYQRVDIDEKTLKRIADATGGLYFRAEDLEGLKTIYNTINQLEKTEAKVKSFSHYRELYSYFLLPAFGLLVLSAVLANTRLLRIP